MALTRLDSEPGSGFGATTDAVRSFFQRKREQFFEASAKRKVFRDTFSELASLSDRELADLGIPRCNIRRLAWEAAHDC